MLPNAELDNLSDYLPDLCDCHLPKKSALTKIGSKGMNETDKLVLEIMTSK